MRMPQNAEITIKEIKASETWDLRHRLMWPNHPFDFIILPNDEQGFHYGLFEKDILVSVVSLFIENDEAQFRKLATETEKRCLGYGSKLLSHVIEVSKKKGLKKLWCNARVEKAIFYERFGLQKTSQTYSKGGIDFVVLEYIF